MRTLLPWKKKHTEMAGPGREEWFDRFPLRFGHGPGGMTARLPSVDVEEDVKVD